VLHPGVGVFGCFFLFAYLDEETNTPDMFKRKKGFQDKTEKAKITILKAYEIISM